MTYCVTYESRNPKGDTFVVNYTLLAASAREARDIFKRENAAGALDYPCVRIRKITCIENQ